MNKDEAGAELVLAIEEGLAAWVAGRRGPNLEHDDVVSRGMRTGSEWLESLRRLGAGAATSYRVRAVEPQRLSLLLDDSRATPSARAAAALVLSASGDVAAAGKLRIAAQSTADPRLRVALESVADASSDDAIAEALETLDEAARRERT